MEKYFESKVIDDLYYIRREGFESSIIKQYGESKEIKQVEKISNELDNLVKKNVKDDKLRDRILSKIDELKDASNAETCYWTEQFYKLGFVDKIGLKEEVKQLRKDFIKVDDSNNIVEKNMNELADYIETEKIKRLKNIKKYVELNSKIGKLKEKYPKVCEFIESKKIDNFTREEIKAISEIIELDSSMRSIIEDESFKLGIKEGCLLG